MSVEALFSSQTKVEVLRTLSGSNRSFSAEELEEETTKNIAAVYRALGSLKREGAIEEVKAKGKTGYHHLNRENELVRRVEQVFQTEKEMYRVKNIPNKALNILFNLKVKLSNRIEGLRRIVLFGSTARGDYAPRSDLDLYIVVDSLDRRKEDIISDTVEEYDHNFSLVVRSREEYISEFKRPISSLAESILKDGYISLYGTPEEDRAIRKQFREEKAMATGRRAEEK